MNVISELFIALNSLEISIALALVFSKKDIYEFNIENSHNFYRQIVENKVGLLKTWAIYWYATIFKSNGFCAYIEESALPV